MGDVSILFRVRFDYIKWQKQTWTDISANNRYLLFKANFQPISRWWFKEHHHFHVRYKFILWIKNIQNVKKSSNLVIVRLLVLVEKLSIGEYMARRVVLLLRACLDIGIIQFNCWVQHLSTEFQKGQFK